MANNDTVDVARGSEPDPKPGPFLAKVISHLDSSYMGGLEVEILRQSGNDGSSGQTHQVKYMSPFYGVTDVKFCGKDDTKDEAQKSYGMWMIPPDPGTTVVVIFIDGDPKRGFWIGCVQDAGANFMVPGLAATENIVGSNNKSRLPVTEYNKTVNAQNTNADVTKIKKPRHPFATVLENSGLDKDDIRGITTSSARRETPSAVFGISTPGPLDKKGKQGIIGKSDHPINNAYVSRLGGTTFVMDDGDDKFLRKKPASEAGPEYVSPEQGDKTGNVGIPHNELVRIRTRTGHQILLHNSEDLIYISHGSGNSWIEMTANGKIDVYAKDSISFHTEKDFNFTAGRDINLTAGVGKDGGNINMNAVTNILETAKQIHLNSSDNTALVTNRRPDREPWAGHENLAPKAKFNDTESGAKKSPDKISSGIPDPNSTNETVWFKKYTTVTDTFNKVKGPDKKK